VFLLLVCLIFSMSAPCVASAAQTTTGTTSEQTKLSSLEQNILKLLQQSINEIAAGTRTSTEITLTWEELGIKTEWTSADLKGARLNASAGHFSDELKNAVVAATEFDLNHINEALLMNDPYTLYWYDKTVGMTTNCSRHLSGTSSSATLTGGVTFHFAVEESYAGSNSYTTSPARTKAAAATAVKAKKVVEANKNLSDREKLAAYRDYVCEQVTYDNCALTNHEPYGDPWQVISVFDTDSTTNVVCEGYAKAFQYLCDLTEFSGDVTCILVDGTVTCNGNTSAHMWNLVTIDGTTYLVDVTNSDEGAVGSKGGLFMVVANGSAANGYSITTDSKTMVYCYDAEDIAYYGTTALTLGAKERNCTSASYSDVDETQWYHDALDYVLENELMSGYSDGRFGTYDALTRGTLALSLYRMSGSPEAGECPFTDVSGLTQEEINAIAWAAEQGIVTGYSDGTFAPNAKITREQLAVMLWRYCGEPTSEQQSTNFDDEEKISSWAADAVCWAAEQGILKGSENKFNPQSNANRAQGAQIILNLAEIAP
jgi:hypothetical protein